MIRALIAEDSQTTRELLVAILGADPELQVVGEAKDGIEAVEMTRRLRPDVVTMDIRMPRMDGFEATRQIMAQIPTPIVVVSASVDAREVQVSMDALRLGALTVLAKPPGPESPRFDEHARRFADTIKAMSQVKVVRRWAHTEPPAPARPQALRQGGRVQVVAIGASTGGPAALARILSDIPGDLAVPVLVVQHIARGFTQGLASWLNASSALRVKVGEQGEALAPRTVYLAPDGRHMGVSADRALIRITDAAPVGGFRPSATLLFQSVAQAFGASTLALILTGMGEDGVAGLTSVRQAGGKIVAQDEASSVVFGMPGAAVAAGLADLTLPLQVIAERLPSWINKGSKTP